MVIEKLKRNCDIYCKKYDLNYRDILIVDLIDILPKFICNLSSD